MLAYLSMGVSTLLIYGYYSLQWDDSIDNLPEGNLNCASRFHLPSPKRDNKSSLERYQVPKLTKRRKRKGWSILEEDTLRAGVQK